MSKPLFSIISPVYRAESLVEKLVDRICAEVSKISSDFEIILVEDASPDNSWASIEKVCATNNHVRGIKLSRNFGQQYAINAGLDASRGAWVIVMDCDLQDKPSEIHKLYAKALEGYDIVLASRINRQDDFLKKFVSYLFNKTLAYLTDTQQDSSVANFVLYSRKAVNALAQLHDYKRYYPMMNQWIGFKRIKIEIEHAEREDGHSSYTFRKRLNLAIETMVAFSEKPLRLTVKLGLIISVLSVLLGLRQLFVYFLGNVSVEGWTSLIIIICFFSGLIISILGIIGLYIGKIFETVKQRPTYIVAEKIGFDAFSTYPKEKAAEDRVVTIKK